jgi:hypothetical protein
MIDFLIDAAIDLVGFLLRGSRVERYAATMGDAVTPAERRSLSRAWRDGASDLRLA